MFANSRNVFINGGQYTNSNVTVEGTVRNDGIDLLRRHSAPGATHDSGERFDPPKCDPDTRKSIIQRLIAWVKSTERSSSMLWLRGSAGVGKSALAQSLAELCATEAILAGSFFFSRTSPDPKRSDGRSLFPTIAYQLLSSFPGTRKFINKTIEDDSSIFDRSLESQMQKLVIEPLNCVANSPMQKLVRLFIRPPVQLIIIDGLDECSDPAVQRELLGIIGTSLQKIPFPFRFLIASRPEAHITQTFKVGLKVITYTEIDLCEDFFAAEDIGIFLRKRFDDIRTTHTLCSYIPSSWPSDDNISELVRRSSGQFIYASTVIKYISSPKHQPTERLKVILGLSPRPEKDTPYAQLDALYMHILSCIDDITTAKIILGVLFIDREESSSTSTPARIGKLLFLNKGDVELVLSDLLSVLTVGGPHQSVRILHTSLPDFLLDPSRSREFYVNVGLSHTALARGYMRFISEATNDLISMRHSWDPIIDHLKNAVLTEALYQDLLDFDFITILHHSSLQLQQLGSGMVDWSSTIEYQGCAMRWVWSFLCCIEKTEAFKYSNDIYDRHMKTFDEHLKRQLCDYLSHQDLVDALTLISLYEDGLGAKPIARCIPILLDSTADLLERKLDSISGQQGYLVLLRRFLQDPKRSGKYFVDDVKYARAAVRCLKAVCMDSFPSPDPDPRQEKEVESPITSTRSTINIIMENAYLECIAALLPKAAISEDLLSLLTNNSKILVRKNNRREKGVVPELVARVEAYLQRGADDAGG